MAKLTNAFDSTQVEEQESSFDLLPIGNYPAQITGSEICDTKAGNGKYIKLEFTIVGAKYSGRKLWSNLNIENKNQVAVQIAQSDLKDICEAVGKSVISDTEELHGVPMQITVKVNPAKGDYPASNAIKKYKKLKSLVGATKTPAFASESPEAISPKEGAIPWGN